MNLSKTIFEKAIDFKSNKNTDEQISSSGFGTFSGVFLPSILSIFGVILFLRFGSILGNIGIIPTLFIVFTSSLITFTTGLSISATATNMHVKGGGAYFMISRSFGVEIGSAIGIALFFAQVIGIAFYIEGLSESVRFLFPSVDPLIFETLSLFFIAAIAYFSSNIALRLQLAIFLIISLALFSFFFGNSTEAVEATSPYTLSFWGSFALFFPAVTGIEAGFSMSGELKNPRRSLPVGTLLAVSIGFVVYSLVAIFLWFRVPESILRSDPMALIASSRFESLIIIGIWGATLSSAIGGILGAPRTLQALSKDGILPIFLGKGYGAKNEPRIATIVTFVIAFLCLTFGNINVLAPILTMFFLISYGMLNLATGLESLFGNPSWRPTFSVPSSVSLLGSLFCLLAMLMINSGATLISIVFILSIYFLTKRKKIGNGWEDIRKGALLFLCRSVIYQLADLGPSARSWRPYFLVFASSPTQKTDIIDFADSITKKKGFLTVASIISSDKFQQEKIGHLEQLIRNFLKKKKIQCLVEVEKSNDLHLGMRTVINNYGLGSITPNTVILGYSPIDEENTKRAETIRLINDLGKNLVILKESNSSTNGSIDIWWDEENSQNNELMIVLAHMLKDTLRWSGCSVIVKCLVSNEEGREQRVAYLKQFFSLSRLKVDVKVLVVPDEETASIKTISKFSSDASILFLGLRNPQIEENNETYGKYLEKLMRSTAHIDRFAFIMGSEKVDLDKIFEYPLD